jgi:hypothetical protein
MKIESSISIVLIKLSYLLLISARIYLSHSFVKVLNFQKECYTISLKHLVDQQRGDQQRGHADEFHEDE